MAKQAQAQKQTVTAKLTGLYAKVGVENLPVNLARDIAVAHGLNATSAEIALYRWREAQGYYAKGAPKQTR